MTAAQDAANRPRIATLVLAVGLAVATVAGCGGAAASSGAPAGTTPPVQTAAAAPSVGLDAAAACRQLQNLKSLDYAFGASFSVIQALDAASKSMTVKDLQAFQAAAPAELQQPVTDLIAFWTALSQDPNSVTESDTRLVSATAALGAWLTANCG